jgi:hypothetical protein
MLWHGVYKRFRYLRGLSFIDMTPIFREAYENGILDLYGRIDNHLAIAGHQLVAEAIYPLVYEQLRR